jgi:hypothetical protein
MHPLQPAKLALPPPVVTSSCAPPLLHCSGLKAPEPSVPRTVDTLWSLGKTSVRAPKQRKALSPVEVEETPFHKARPDTNVEREACMRELTPAELASLVVGPKVCSSVFSQLDCVCLC